MVRHRVGKCSRCWLVDGHRAPPFGMEPNQNSDRAHFQRSRRQDAELPQSREVFGSGLYCPDHASCRNQTAETLFGTYSKTARRVWDVLGGDVSMTAPVSLAFCTTPRHPSPYPSGVVSVTSKHSGVVLGTHRLRMGQRFTGLGRIHKQSFAWPHRGGQSRKQDEEPASQ